MTWLVAATMAVLAGAFGVFAGRLAYAGPLDAGAARIACTLAVILAAALMAPVRRRTGWHPVAGPIAWATGWGLLSGLASLCFPGPPGAASIAALAVAAAAIVFFLERAHRALAGWRGGETGATAALLALAVPATAAPLWLGPFSVRPEAGEAVASVALWASPIGYFAAATGVDVLRSTFLYAQSPLGSVPYAYPDPVLYGAIALTLGAALWCVPGKSSSQEN